MADVSRILVVEDAEVIRASVVAALRAQGHRVKGVADGSDLEAQLIDTRAEVVVLDVMLPGGRDGFELLEVIRRLSRAGVIMLTARDQLDDKVYGLRLGADDYLSKPFAMAELLARVESLLRRSGSSGRSVTIGDLVIADEAARVTRAGRLIELTETERRVLNQLAMYPDRVVSKTHLLTSVWGYDGYDENIVEVHVSSLRRRLEGGDDSRVIHTVRGRGYRLGLQ